MDLCSWAAPALMERRRAAQEEWKKRRVEEKVKQRLRRGVEGARFPQKAAFFFRHSGTDANTDTNVYADKSRQQIGSGNERKTPW